MSRRRAVRSGAFAAAACVACCAPPIIATLGVTAGLAATAGVFLGLAVAATVVLLGVGWLGAQAARAGSARRTRGCATDAVAVAAPVRRPAPMPPG